MKLDVTILYYTSNKEGALEEKAIENILRNKGDLPVVSVSHEPLEFGENICVGKHPSNYFNLFRQVQLGLRAIKTPYVLVAESDTLYPPDYFTLEPTGRGQVYRYDNVWVHYTKFNGRPKVWFKEVSDCAQMVDREMWLEKIDSLLPHDPEWMEEKIKVPLMQFRNNGKHYWTGNPVVTFKTGNGVKSSTATKKGVPPQYSLPFWGDAQKLREEVFS